MSRWWCFFFSFSNISNVYQKKSDLMDERRSMSKQKQKQHQHHHQQQQQQQQMKKVYLQVVIVMIHKRSCCCYYCCCWYYCYWVHDETKQDISISHTLTDISANLPYLKKEMMKMKTLMHFVIEIAGMMNEDRTNDYKGSCDCHCHRI